MEAIVCKVLDYKDSSKILYLYTEQGNKSIIARGVKKLNSINRYLSQVPNIISYEASKGTFPSLQEGHLMQEFGDIQLDIEKFTFVSHILELVINTIDEQSNHSKMYDFLKRLLYRIDKESDPEILSFIFELKLLSFLGYGIRFNGCNQCDEGINLVYSVRNGGLICRRHLEPLEEAYDLEITQKIKELYYMDINQYFEIPLSKNERIMIRHIIDVTFDDFIGYHSKSRTILKQIKKY